MDHLQSYSFPGMVFLFAQLTYRFVPYGDLLLIFIALFFLLSRAAQLIYQVCGRRSVHGSRQIR